jgi:hypothetical protein
MGLGEFLLINTQRSTQVVTPIEKIGDDREKWSPVREYQGYRTVKSLQPSL